MRFASSLHTAPPRMLLSLAATALLGVATACGGGQQAQPTVAATVAASPAAVPTAARPSLASPVASPSPVPTAVAKPTGSTGPSQDYTVVAGDTLLSIAERFYSDATLWQKIYDANKDVIGPNPDALKLDQKLKIPPKDS